MPTIKQSTFENNYFKVKQSFKELEEFKSRIYNSDNEFNDNFLINHRVSEAIMKIDDPYKEVVGAREQLENLKDIGNIDNTKKLDENINVAKEIENEYRIIASNLIGIYKKGDAIDVREQGFLDEMRIVKDLN